MKVSAKQILVAVISLVMTLGVLLGGEKLYRTTIVDSPLMSNLGTIQGVTHANLQGDVVTVRVKNGADLMTVYQSVTTAATRALGHAPTKIVLKSHSNATLNRLAENAAFVIAQGEATGQYVAMKQSLKAQAATDGARAAVELDSHHVYITWHQQQSVLYDVQPIEIGGSSHA